MAGQYQTPIYTEQGGAHRVYGAGAAMTHLDQQIPMGATITVGAEATNVINVAVQLLSKEGTDLANRGVVHFYLAGDANGDTLATAPSGGIAVGTDGLCIETLADLAGMLVSEADGDIDINITDTGTPTIYLVLVLPTGARVISGAITFA